MDAALKEINAVLGVKGSFVIAVDGSIAASALSDSLDPARIATAARIVTQTFDALETSKQRVAEMDLLFGQSRLILKNLRVGVLAVLCTRNINLPLLNLTADVAAKKITAELKAGLPPAPPGIVGKIPLKIWGVEVTPSPLFTELEQEMRQVVEVAQKSQVTLRAMDPLAMWVCCSRTHALVSAPTKRQIDFAGQGAQRDAIARVFEQAGYQANRRFNALYGNRRLNFRNVLRELSADVHLDTFEMYHHLDLKAALAQDGITLPETVLLLMRLQLVEMTDTGLRDLCALFLEHDLSVGYEKEKIDAAEITRLCADDWGWHKTVLLNLDRVDQFAKTMLVSPEQATVVERAQRLKKSIEDAPKSLRWQTRARLGEGVRWYEIPLTPGQSIRPDIAIG